MLAGRGVDHLAVRVGVKPGEVGLGDHHGAGPRHGVTQFHVTSIQSARELESFALLRDIRMSRWHHCRVPSTRPTLALVADTPDSTGRCVDCGAPSGRRKRCADHHARHSKELAAERQRRRRAELRSGDRAAGADTVKDAADALTTELAALWVHSELPNIDLYKPVIRCAAQLLDVLRDSTDMGDPK